MPRFTPALQLQVKSEVMRLGQALRDFIYAEMKKDPSITAEDLWRYIMGSLQSKIDRIFLTEDDRMVQDPEYRKLLYISTIVDAWEEYDRMSPQLSMAPSSTIPIGAQIEASAEGVPPPTPILRAPPNSPAGLQIEGTPQASVRISVPPPLRLSEPPGQPIPLTPAQEGGFSHRGYYRVGGRVPQGLRDRVTAIVNRIVVPMSDFPNTPMAVGIHDPEMQYLGESTRYIPLMPQISEAKTSTQPCMFEHRIARGPGFWKYACDRSGKPGIKRCQLKRVERDQSTLVPINCTQEYVNVLKGYQVDRRTQVTPDGQKITRQVITPEVDTFGSIRKRGPAGPGVPVRLTAEEEAEIKTLRASQMASNPYGAMLTEARNDHVWWSRRGTTSPAQWTRSTWWTRYPTPVSRSHASKRGPIWHKRYSKF